jgi:hypothetical protein
MTVVRLACAAFLVAHGVAHLIGFIAAWRLAAFADAPYTTQVLGGTLDVGDVGIRIVGLLWVGAAAGFVAAAIAVWRRRGSRIVALAAAGSLVVTLIGLPAAFVGLWIDLAILGGLALVAVARRSATSSVAS